jgi:hypothetical protein
VLNKGIRAGVGALPVIGSSLTEFLAFVVGDPAQERRDDFMRETLERVLELEGRFERLESEALRSNEQFQATFIQATRLSTQAASKEKRKLLQNAILNSAILDIEENLRQILMLFLERITPLHAAVLSLFLHDPASNERVQQILKQISEGNLSRVLEVAIPELNANRPLAERIVSDLDAMGLSSGAGQHFNVKIQASRLMECRSSPLGQLFLQFISDPNG